MAELTIHYNEEMQKLIDGLVRTTIIKLEENLMMGIRPGEMLSEIRILNNAVDILKIMKYDKIQEIEDIKNKYFEYQNKHILKK